MSNKIFTDKEINLLSKNQYVKSVSSKGITYTDEFKHIFISENVKGKNLLVKDGVLHLKRTVNWGFVTRDRLIQEEI